MKFFPSWDLTHLGCFSYLYRLDLKDLEMLKGIYIHRCQMWIVFPLTVLANHAIWPEGFSEEICFNLWVSLRLIRTWFKHFLGHLKTFLVDLWSFSGRLCPFRHLSSYAHHWYSSFFIAIKENRHAFLPDTFFPNADFTF